MPPFCKPRATDAVLLLLRMALVQSVTQCEAAAVFAHPAASLLLSHCINSRESTPRACKRHTPLSLLQDPDTPQIHDEKENTQLWEDVLHCPFRYWFLMCVVVLIYCINTILNSHYKWECASTDAELSINLLLKKNATSYVRRAERCEGKCLCMSRKTCIRSRLAEDMCACADINSQLQE